MSLQWYASLCELAEGEVEDAFYAKTRAAEESREDETGAAVRLQATWRGRTTRILIAYWAEHALLVERVSRGHLGRQEMRRKRIARNLLRQRAFFDAYATAIQLRFRGFHSRKFLHNFYARKAYVTAVVQKGEEVRARLQQRLEQQVSPARCHAPPPLRPNALLWPVEPPPSDTFNSPSDTFPPLLPLVRSRRRRASRRPTAERPSRASPLASTTSAPQPRAPEYTIRRITRATTRPPSGSRSRSTCRMPSARRSGGSWLRADAR